MELTNRNFDFISLISEHRSIRKFSDEKIPEEAMEKIITAAQSASSSSHGQAYSIINVTSSEKRKILSEYAGNQKQVIDSSHFLVFCADLHRLDRIAKLANVNMKESLDSTEMFIVATVDAALAAQNTAIAAESIGYGIVYTGGIRNKPAEVAELLNLPYRTYPVFGMCIGHPISDQIPDKKPRLPTESIFFEDVYPDFDEKYEHLQQYDQLMKKYYMKRKGGSQKEKTWSEVMTDKRKVPRRQDMKLFLNNQKFLIK
jgi:FMN reductase (NADPH)